VNVTQLRIPRKRIGPVRKLWTGKFLLEKIVSSVEIDVNAAFVAESDVVVPFAWTWPITWA